MKSPNYSATEHTSGATYLGVEEFGARRLLILEGGQKNVVTEHVRDLAHPLNQNLSDAHATADLS